MAWRAARVRVAWAGLLGLIAGCGGSSSSATPAGPQWTLDRAAVVDAFDYWQSAVGIDYVLIEADALPRILVRLGNDGLGPQGGGRAGIDGTFTDNRAQSGIVVIEPEGGQYCRSGAAWCRYLYRHEIGHALGFLAHSDFGLMNATPDVLVDREKRMIAALYSLPHGAQVEEDGTWSVPATGAEGRLDDVQTARDVIAWNMNAPAGASHRQLGVISRWALPVRVYLRPY